MTIHKPPRTFSGPQSQLGMTSFGRGATHHSHDAQAELADVMTAREAARQQEPVRETRFAPVLTVAARDGKPTSMPASNFSQGPLQQTAYGRDQQEAEIADDIFSRQQRGAADASLGQQGDAHTPREQQNDGKRPGPRLVAGKFVQQQG